MSRAVRFSCALVMIALVICSSPTVATPKSTSAGVVLNTLHSSHAPAMMKRRLRSTMAMETTETSEERASTFRNPEVASSFSSLKTTSAAIYEKLQRWVWRLTRQTPDNVFKLLKLDKIDKPNKISTENAKLFGDPRFKKWVNFVYKRKSEKPEATTEAIFATLAAHYGDGATLATLFYLGKLHIDDRPIADLVAVLQVAQLQHWNKDGKSVKNVLEILELHKTQGNPLRDPLFSQLSAYVELKHPKDPTAATKAMLTAFRNFYTDDTAWAKILVDGTKRGSVINIAYDLLQLQLSLWEEGEKTLFTLLELGRIKEGLFENPLFKQWVAIVKDIHWETPKTASDVILSTLAAHFGKNAAWADILVAGTKDPRTEHLAFKLMMRQNERWRDIEKKSVDEVFTLLKLENGLFESPRMLLWLDFVERYFIEKKNAMYSRSRPAQLVGIFSKLGYDEAIKAAEKADAVAEEAQKAADEVAEEAQKAAIEAKKEADAVAEEAKKAADAAARKAEEAENVIKKAEMAPYEAMLSTLRHHSKSDSALRNSLAKGMEVDNWKVRQTAKELRKMLDSSRPQEDLSKVSAPGAEPNSNFDVHG